MEAIGDDGAVNPTGDLQSSKPTSKVETSGIVQPPRERLSPSAVRLIVMLRPKLSLMRTAARFPHIVNGLARAASEPRLLLAQLDKLLHDERGDREGFPFQVIVELTHLRELYEQEAARC